MRDLCTPVPADKVTFANRERCLDINSLDAHIAILGTPFGMRYPSSAPRPTQDGPASIRAHSQRHGKWLHGIDFDFGGPLLNNKPIRIVDCGDVIGSIDEGEENHQRVEAAIKRIREQGAVPIVLGGNDSIPIPVMRGVSDSKDVTLFQFDAHLDYRDEVDGIRDGESSNIRRGSEMAHMRDIVQIGIRDIGSADAETMREIHERGNTIISATDVEENGASGAIARFPKSSTAFIAFDMDGMDPSIAPGVSAPAFGGLSYRDTRAMLGAIAESSEVVGLCMMEVIDALDPRGLTSVLAARLILDLIGSMARSQQFADVR